MKKDFKKIAIAMLLMGIVFIMTSSLNVVAENNSIALKQNSLEITDEKPEILPDHEMTVEIELMKLAKAQKELEDRRDALAKQKALEEQKKKDALKKAQVEAEKAAKALAAKQAEELRQQQIKAAEAERVAKEQAAAKAKAEAAEKQKAQAQAKTASVPETSASAGQGQTFAATYYSANCAGCSGITATGIDVRQTTTHQGLRIIAVDPSVIRLGSIVEVSTSQGTFQAIAGDTGGAIKGSKIDILVGSQQEALSLGRETVTVRILK